MNEVNDFHKSTIIFINAEGTPYFYLNECKYIETIEIANSNKLYASYKHSIIVGRLT